MLQFMQTRNAASAFKWGLRVGIHSGPVVSGVVGKRKYAFDVWGDTVNIAARMEASGEVGRVNVSAYTCHLIRDEFTCEYRGKLEVKGKGLIDMYFVKEL
jgi:class 3 adenylate cyclase